MRERVELLAGAIQVESSPGNGTTVTARLPVQRRPGESAAATQHPLRPTGTP
jgi:signal transduction histidine kinase